MSTAVLDVLLPLQLSNRRYLSCMIVWGIRMEDYQPLFHPNFGGVRVAPERPSVGVSPRISLNLFGREIIFEEFQPM